MSDSLKKLNTVMAKQYAGTGENSLPELALIVSANKQPTFGLVDSAGTRFNWSQHLTRPATLEEVARYWQERARRAELALEAERARER